MKKLICFIVVLFVFLLFGKNEVYAGTASVVGKVVKSDGSTPLENAEIMLRNASWSYNWATSTSSGNFIFNNLDAGTYTMEFRAPWNSQGLVEPSPISNITLTDGQTYYRDGTNGTDCSSAACPVITFSTANNTISGTVKKSNGNPISGAYVEGYKESGSGWIRATTNASGEYSMQVGAGNWMISPRANYGADPSAIDWTYSKMPTRVSFANNNSPGTTTTTNFTVQTADCSITGTIRDPDGNSLSNPQNSVYVSVWSYSGGGNSSNVSSDGSFNLKVPEGTYNLNINVWGQNYGSPNETKFTVKDADSNGSCDGYAAGTIRLVNKNSYINGIVSDTNGARVANQSVSAWKYNGGGWASAMTDSNGAYSLQVAAGTWQVSISTGMSGSYGSATTYINDQAPIQVIVGDNQTSASNNFTLKIANSTISGRVVDSSNSTLTGLEMGYAYVETGSSSGPGPMMYSGMGAMVRDGTFTLSVPAGTYNVGVSLPYGSGYCTGSASQVTATANATASATISLTTATASISGLLKKDSDTGDTITGVRAEIFANSGTMNYAMATVNSSNGTYTMSVCPGDWYMGYWIDPSLTDGENNTYLRQPLSNNKITVTGGQTATKNIIVKKNDATISGTVTDPNGSAFAGVWVSVDTRSNDTAGSFNRSSWFSNGAMTDSTGTYSIKVPSGSTYNVIANIPGSSSYINPNKVSVTPTSGGTSTVNLQFKNADATITGTTTQGGSAIAAFITAWSEDGGYAGTTSGSNGIYSLSVSSGTSWHVKAMYESGTTFYRSNESIVSPSAGSNTLNLNLSNSGTMPESTTTTFSASNQKTITLSDGTTITIPAGALASSGNVTVTVTAKVQLPNQALAAPIKLGYDITALDSNGSEITSTFNSNVTIVMPYTEADLTALGLTEDDLLAGYWDSSTNSWKTSDNISIDKDNNTITLTTNHFTDFAPFSAGKKSTSASASTSTTSSSSGSSGGGSSSPQILALQGKIITTGRALIVIDPGTLKWDAYVSSTIYNKNYPKKVGNLWQLSDIYDLWFRAFSNNAKIINPFKPSIVAIKYSLDQLGQLPESSLALALSTDEGKTWKILPTSILDKKNKTVAALSKVGGQYMLIAGFAGQNKNIEQKQQNNENINDIPEKKEPVKQDAQPQGALPSSQNPVKNNFPAISLPPAPSGENKSFFQKVAEFIGSLFQR